MSDNLMRQNRLIMRNSYRVKVGTGIENHYYMSYLSATLQALFACEEFRVKLILFAEEYKPQDIHTPEDIRFHIHIADLYKHMVIGKQAFVIPALNVLTTQLTKQLIEWQEVNPKDFIDNLLASLHTLYQKYKNTAPTQATIDKCPTQPIRGTEIWFCGRDSMFALLEHKKIVFRQSNNWTTSISRKRMAPFERQPQLRNIEDEVNSFGHTVYEKRKNACKDCGSETAKRVWYSPSILILALNPTKNKVEIQHTFKFESQTYSLFAYVCKQVIAEHYNCCTKFGEQWTYFDGKIAEEITKPVNNLTNVCLMFYQRNESADIKPYSKIVDKLISEFVKLNRNFDFEIEPQMRDANLIQPQSAFRPLRETTEPSFEALHQLRKTANLGLKNTERMNICYLNTTVQSLYACRLFRKYLTECDKSIGRFHNVLKSLFISMTDRNSHDTNNFQKILHNLYRQLYKELKEVDSAYCIYAILLQLHRECINFGSAEVIDVRMRVIYNRIVDPTNYDDSYCGREDLTSISSLNEHVIAEHNSYITNLFTIQLISSERCKFGHKSGIKFSYQYAYLIQRSYYRKCKSLQQIVHMLTSCGEQLLEKNCQNCPKESNDLYKYSLSIRRISNILVFMFQVPWYSNATWKSFAKLNMHLEEYLMVFGQIYRCMAWTVYWEPERNGMSHVYAYCHSDNGYWYEFDDMDVTNFGYRMPQIRDFNEPKSTIDLVFYERVFDEHKSDSDSDSITSRVRSCSDITVENNSRSQWRPRSGSHTIGDRPIRQSIVGFTNSTGFRSYMNSVIQCLYRCSKFRNYITHEQLAIEVIVEYPLRSTHYILRKLFVDISSNNRQTINTTDIWFFNQFTEKHAEYDRNTELDPRDLFALIVWDLLAEDNQLPDDADSRSGMESERILNDARNREIVVSWGQYVNSHVVEMFCVITQCNIFCSQTETHNKVCYNSDTKLELIIIGIRTNNSVQSLVNEYLLRSKRDTIECKDCKQANQHQNENPNPNPNPNGNANVAHELKYILRTPDILVIQFDSINPDIMQLFVRGFHVKIDEHIVVCEQNYTFRSCICCDHKPENPRQPYHFKVYVRSAQLYCIDDSDITPQPPTVLERLNNVFMVFYEKI